MTEPESFAPGIPLDCRIAFGLVTLVAGVVGVIMLVAPDPASTTLYFSWGIRPAPLSALVGSWYVCSAVVFAIVAVRNRWPEAQVMCVGGLGLTVPTFVSTLVDTDLFDFGRFTALVWPLLFAVAPVYFGLVLFRGRRRPGLEPGTRMRPALRWLIGLLGAVYALLAVPLLIYPALVSGLGPYDMARLSGRFIGAWLTFLAAIAIFAAVRDRAGEAWLAGLVLTLWPLAGLAAALRTPGELAADRRVGYLIALLLLLLAGAVAFTVARIGRPEPEPPAEPAAESGSQ